MWKRSHRLALVLASSPKYLTLGFSPDKRRCALLGSPNQALFRRIGVAKSLEPPALRHQRTTAWHISFFFPQRVKFWPGTPRQHKRNDIIVSARINYPDLVSLVGPDLLKNVKLLGKVKVKSSSSSRSVSEFSVGHILNRI